MWADALSQDRLTSLEWEIPESTLKKQTLQTTKRSTTDRPIRFPPEQTGEIHLQNSHNTGDLFHEGKLAPGKVVSYTIALAAPLQYGCKIYLDSKALSLSSKKKLLSTETKTKIRQTPLITHINTRIPLITKIIKSTVFSSSRFSITCTNTT